MKTLFVLLVGLMACDVAPTTSLQKEQSYIHYYKDDRTGLCFAGSSRLNANWSVLTYVPCSPEVERLVEALP